MTDLVLILQQGTHRTWDILYSFGKINPYKYKHNFVILQSNLAIEHGCLCEVFASVSHDASVATHLDASILCLVPNRIQKFKSCDFFLSLFPPY